MTHWPGKTLIGWRPRAAILAVGLGMLLVGLVPGLARSEVVQVPNLVPHPPYEVHVNWADDAESFDPGEPRAIRFSISTANRGAYALELSGDPSTHWVGTGPAERDARQCVWWVSRVCTHRTAAGQFVWHDAHSHWHFEDYAVYELRLLGSDGLPIMSGPPAVPGYKASFCLLDGWQEGEPPPGHDPLAQVGLYKTCNELIQGISPGWADEYGWNLAGQQLQIPPGGIQSGLYALVVTVNPEGIIRETNYDDNVAFTVVQISDQGETVICPTTPERCGAGF